MPADDDMPEDASILAGEVRIGADEVRDLLRETVRVRVESAAVLDRATRALDASTEVLQRLAETEERRIEVAEMEQRERERRQARWSRLLTDMPAWAVSLITLLGTILLAWLAGTLGVPLPGAGP